MRHLVAVAPGELRWEETTEPVLEGAGDALVRPVAVTLCDLDRPMVTGAFPLPLPIPLGHELVAEVVATGDEVSTVRPGDRVVVPFQISCGTCGSCVAGLTANCRSVPPRSQYGFGEVGGPWGSGFADLVRVPFADRMLQQVPDHVPTEAVVAAGDNLGDGWRHVGPHLAAKLGATVLILGGTGSVPLYAAMFAVGLGAGRVDYVDADAGRRAVAEGFGARAHADASSTPNDAYDIAVDGTLLDPTGLATACRALRPDGTVSGATMYVSDPTLPYLELYMKGAHFHTGRVHALALAPVVLDLVSSGLVDPRPVSGSEILTFDDASNLLTTGTKPIFLHP